jgi:hypothetical protein
VRARQPELAVRRSSCRPAWAAAWLALAIILLAPVASRAAPATYTGEAPVNSQSDDERVDALKTALASVVIQQTGDPGVLSRADVAAAVAKADRYVLQFRYRKNTDGSGAPLALVAEFDSAAVDQMLQKLGLAEAAPGTAAAIDATPTEASVWIGGIRSAEDYARVVGYLGKSALVRSVRPQQARGDGMLVKLSLGTDLAHFLDAVGMERTLSVVSASPPVDGVDATLALAP